jgi:transcriptional regulator with XRE-family HTH domain
MIERILEIMKERKLTPSQFADEIGIQRSGVSHLISGRNKPSLEFIMKVLKRFPDVKADYLLYGITEPGASAPVLPIIEKEVSHKIPGTLFDQPEITEIRAEPKAPRTVRKEKTERRVEKIVVFYDDKTFREYEPE